jgi:hypothetical protein
MSPEHARYLAEFGIGPDDLIGEGGESFVYALGADAVLRLPKRPHFDGESRERLQIFLEHIAGQMPFATPEILEIGPSEDWTVERRLPGRPMLEMLRTLADDKRDKALRNYVAAIDGFSAIRLDEFPYGHVLAQSAVTAADWQTFLWESLIGFRTRNRVAVARGRRPILSIRGGRRHDRFAAEVAGQGDGARRLLPRQRDARR